MPKPSPPDIRTLVQSPYPSLSTSLASPRPAFVSSKTSLGGPWGRRAARNLANPPSFSLCSSVLRETSDRLRRNSFSVPDVTPAWSKFGDGCTVETARLAAPDEDGDEFLEGKMIG